MNELFGKSGQRARDVENPFVQISLFGENRREIFKEKICPIRWRNGLFFTEREKKFLMLCGRTPARNQARASRKRIVVRQIILFL